MHPLSPFLAPFLGSQSRICTHNKTGPWTLLFDPYGGLEPAQPSRPSSCPALLSTSSAPGLGWQVAVVPVCCCHCSAPTAGTCPTGSDSPFSQPSRLTLTRPLLPLTDAHDPHTTTAVSQPTLVPAPVQNTDRPPLHSLHDASPHSPDLSPAPACLPYTSVNFWPILLSLGSPHMPPLASHLAHTTPFLPAFAPLLHPILS